MGEMDVPADALYGASTQRAVLNFPISGQASRDGSSRRWPSSSWRPPRPTPNSACWSPDVAMAIAEAAREVADGAHDDQFPIDVYQTGSGTSTNTNMNEVVAHLAAPAWATVGRSTRTTTSIGARAATTRSRPRSS